jgi:hypothetical protein
MNANLPSRPTVASQISASQISASWFGILAVALAAILLAFPLSARASDWPKQQSPELVALRSSSSPAEKKLSFNLLLLSRGARNAPLGSLAALVDSSAVNPDGTLTVDIVAYLSPSLVASPVMEQVVRLNGAIPLAAYVSDHLRVRVSKRQLLDLAANPNVLAIQDTDTPTNISLAANPQPQGAPASN